MPASSKLEIIVNAKDNASGVLARIGGGLSSLGGIATSVAIGGLAAVAGGLAAIGTVGLSFNSQIEQVTARLNAFTKDGAETARILEQIKVEAAKTPFEFQEMANATANLMSSARQANIPLMDLIKTSEILAASNPAQGLEGAAFSLKEALSGDFVSIVERFNLPRQRLKELKEEGVPAMEAISIAMKEMGLDSSLVSNMAETAAGRWSTLKDTFVNLAGTVTQPIFDTFSEGLGKVNKWLEDNEVTLQQWAETGRQSIQAVIDIITPLAEGDTDKALFNFQASLSKLGVSDEQIGGITELINSVQSEAERLQGLKTTFQAGGLFGSRSGSFGSEGLLNALGIPPNIIDTMQTTFNEITEAYTGFMTGGIFGAEKLTPGGTAQTGGLLRSLGFSDEEVASISDSITSITNDAERIGESFGKIFGEANASGVEAMSGGFKNIADAIENIANAVDAVERIVNLISNSGIVSAATAIAGIVQISPSQIAGNIGALQEADAFLKSPGMSQQGLVGSFQSSVNNTPANQVGQGGQFGGSFDWANLGQIIVSAFQSAPPPIVNVSATLNGKEIAQDVSATLGSQARSLSRQGGFNPQ